MTYRFEFDETGGYDCMYGAFRIYGPDNAVLFDIDLQHYGQKSCDWQDAAAIEKARIVAQKVIDALTALDAAGGRS